MGLAEAGAGCMRHCKLARQHSGKLLATPDTRRRRYTHDIKQGAGQWAHQVILGHRGGGGDEHDAELSKARRQANALPHRPKPNQVSLEILIDGNFDEKSLFFAAIANATLRATAL